MEQQLPRMLRASIEARLTTMLKDQYHQTYFQLKKAIKAFAELSTVRLVACKTRII
jgi:hypothetical protein